MIDNLLNVPGGLWALVVMAVMFGGTALAIGWAVLHRHIHNPLTWSAKSLLCFGVALVLAPFLPIAPWLLTMLWQLFYVLIACSVLFALDLIVTAVLAK